MMTAAAVKEQSECLADACDDRARAAGMLYRACPSGTRIDAACTEQYAVLDDDGVAYLLPVFLKGTLNGDVRPGGVQDAGEVQAVRPARP